MWIEARYWASWQLDLASRFFGFVRVALRRRPGNVFQFNSAQFCCRDDSHPRHGPTALLVTYASSRPTVPVPAQAKPYRKGEVLIRFKEGSSESDKENAATAHRA